MREESLSLVSLLPSLHWLLQGPGIIAAPLQPVVMTCPSYSPKGALLRKLVLSVFYIDMSSKNIYSFALFEQRLYPTKTDLGGEERGYEGRKITSGLS